MEKREMTINEIAALAGVSRATVSRYLNKGYVSEEKREKIRKVIEETGYQPSSQAQMLRSRKTKLIGVIIPKINSHTISRMVGGISKILSENDYQLILANTENNEGEELKYLKLFQKNRVDGVILSGTIFTKKHIQLIREYQVPIVILGQRLSGHSCVYQDDFHAAKEMAGRLLQHCRCLCYIGVTKKDEAAGRGRQEGVEEAFREMGMNMEKWQTQEGAFNVEAGISAAQKLLERCPAMDGLLCATDELAIGAILYLKAQGKKIPEEIRVAGFGDTPMAQIVEPNLTSVHYYYKTSGEEAAQLMMNLLEMEKPVHKEVKMGFEIVCRESSGNVAVR